MNIGKTLFSQLMDFLPWSTFTRIVERHGGDHYIKSLTCADQFRVMAFAQLTYRESLRDIEVCLSAQAAKLYHMGFRHEIKRSTLADANQARDWRIYAEFAQRLIAQARTLYAHDSFGIELTNTTYALDSTTIDLCLSLFPWALFRTNNFTFPAAVICALYKRRWQVELFFKWIKQHLRIKKFYGNSENAVKSQIWIAVSVYVLVAIVKKRLNLDASLYTLLQILSLTLFEKLPLQQAFMANEYTTTERIPCKQLNLLGF